MKLFFWRFTIHQNIWSFSLWSSKRYEIFPQDSPKYMKFYFWRFTETFAIFLKIHRNIWSLISEDSPKHMKFFWKFTETFEVLFLKINRNLWSFSEGFRSTYWQNISKMKMIHLVLLRALCFSVGECQQYYI